MKTTIWIQRVMAVVMAGLASLPVKGLADGEDCGGHASEPVGHEVVGEPVGNDAAMVRDTLMEAAAERIPANDPAADPLEGPEWDPNHDMRGILYDENGNEINRLGRESNGHRRTREERERREREERERREREARERRERQERERREREERERRQREERERRERERQEREERERQEREERERARRAAEERERAEREARNRRTATHQEQLGAAAGAGTRPPTTPQNTARSEELRQRERINRANRNYERESSNFTRSGQSTGWSGSNSAGAQVGEQMVEVVGGGPVPVTAVNAVGELNRVAPVLKARSELIEELSR